MQSQQQQQTGSAAAPSASSNGHTLSNPGNAGATTANGAARTSNGAAATSRPTAQSTSTSSISSSAPTPAARVPAPASASTSAATNSTTPATTTASNTTNGSTGNPTATTAATAASQGGYRPLNVKDALSYLDSVKLQFQRRPQIYNNFLDIMKDFKTQNIDTPGVIDRVSSLFRGHPALIQGFNTFLPPGFRIDCSTDSIGNAIITITTPTGTTRRDANATVSTNLGPIGSTATAAVRQANPAAASASSTPSSQQQQLTGMAARDRIAGSGGYSNNVSPYQQSHQHSQQQASSAATAASSGQPATTTSSAAASSSHLNSLNSQQAAAIAGRTGPSPFSGGIAALNPSGHRIGGGSNTAVSTAAVPTTAAAARAAHAAGAPTSSHSASQASPSLAGATASHAHQHPAASAASGASAAERGQLGGGSSASSGTRPPAEFNHAITFVNKIKSRFNTRPTIYKAFLEILQTYQKEQRAIQDVYAQVTILFADAPDLLEEFKEFLPDTTGQAGLSGAQTSAINQASASAGAGTPIPASASQTGYSTPTAGAQTATTSALTGGGGGQGAATTAGAARTAAQGRTTSLFGVNPSSTSLPQPGPVPSYLHQAARDRARTGPIAQTQLQGGANAATTLDSAASRRALIGHDQGGNLNVANGTNGPGTLSAQGSAGSLERADQAARAREEDEDWQGPSSAKKRRAGGNSVAGIDKTKTKRGKHAHDGSPDEPLASGSGAGLMGYGTANRTYAGPVTHLAPAVQPVVLPHALRPHGPRSQIQPMVNNDELVLFDRIKKYIDDKATYHEFLKLLNLYTAEIIDMQTLLEKAFLFIGGNDEIFGLFREFVGEQDGFVEGEEWPIDNAPALERERFELFTLKSYGPSYRKLPYQEAKGLACSGRDALCWSVLNDDWVSFATWASEGSGAHRKNAYEDALACSEQERHWYSHHLESVHRSIAVLEPVVARISLMTPEERAAFRLKPGLLGKSSSFYERIIRKIYGKDQGAEAIQALYESPGTAAPIILSRMKQKDEEWNRALREWNRVWREVDAKNYYRSLDHQGMTFKTNDKKTTTSKFLIAEIETLRKDQQQKRVFPAHKATATESLRPRHQFEMHIGEFDVVFDVLKLIFSYLDRGTTPYTAKDRMAIENTLRRFVPLLFNIPDKEVDANLAPAIVFGEDGDNGAETEQGDSDNEEAANGAASDTAASMSDASATNGSIAGFKKGKKSAADLRKKLLTSAVNGANGNGVIAAAEKQETAEEEDQEAVQTMKPDTEAEDTTSKDLLSEASWISASAVPWPRKPTPIAPGTPDSMRASPSKFKSKPVASPAPEQAEKSNWKGYAKEFESPRYNFFASQSFYCFIRLFHLLYHRLATLKRLAKELAARPTSEERLNPFAVELGYAAPITQIDEPGIKRGKNFYEYMLELCERYFDAEIDSATFEENLRYMWGIKAFPAFTIDKLVASMIKHAHTLNADARCQGLLDLLKTDRETERTSVRYQIAYRHSAEAVIGGDENMFRLEWLPHSEVLTIQLLSVGDLTIDDPVLTSDKKWGYYVDTYTLGQPTEGLGTEVVGPLLDRNRVANGEEPQPALVQGKSDLSVRVGYGDFKLSYVKETEETIYKTGSTPDDEAIEAVRTSRRRAWEKWLAGQSAEPEPAAQAAEAVDDPAQPIDVEMVTTEPLAATVEDDIPVPQVQDTDDVAMEAVQSM